MRTRILLLAVACVGLAWLLIRDARVQVARNDTVASARVVESERVVANLRASRVSSAPVLPKLTYSQDVKTFVEMARAHPGFAKAYQAAHLRVMANAQHICRATLLVQGKAQVPLPRNVYAYELIETYELAADGTHHLVDVEVGGVEGEPDPSEFDFWECMKARLKAVQPALSTSNIAGLPARYRVVAAARFVGHRGDDRADYMARVAGLSEALEEARADGEAELPANQVMADDVELYRCYLRTGLDAASRAACVREVLGVQVGAHAAQP